MKRIYFLIAFVILVAIYFLVNNFLAYKKFGGFDDANLNKLSMLVIKGDYFEAEKLLKSRKVSLNDFNKNGQTLLYLHVVYNNFDAFKWFLEKGANPNLLFSNNEDSVMRKVAECNENKFLIVALKNGGDPLLLHAGGKRPLFFASLINQQENMSILIKAGDNGNISDQFFNTTITCLLQYSNFKAINFLIEKGLDPYQSSQEIKSRIIFFIESRFGSISKDLKPDFDEMVTKLKEKGFIIELLSLDDFQKKYNFK